MCMCNAESHKGSAKGSNFKEDDMALPLYISYYSLILSLLYSSFPEAGRVVGVRRWKHFANRDTVVTAA